MARTENMQEQFPLMKFNMFCRGELRHRIKISPADDHLKLPLPEQT